MTDEIKKTEQLIKKTTEELPTSQELISNAIKTLREVEGTDVALLDILTKTLLTMKPVDTAVLDAAKAVEDLAFKRTEASVDD